MNEIILITDCKEHVPHCVCYKDFLQEGPVLHAKTTHQLAILPALIGTWGKLGHAGLLTLSPFLSTRLLRFFLPESLLLLT